jgi:hypothetical protein
MKLGTRSDLQDKTESTPKKKVRLAARSRWLSCGALVTLGMASVVGACSSEDDGPTYIYVIQQAGTGGTVGGAQGQGGTAMSPGATGGNGSAVTGGNGSSGMSSGKGGATATGGSSSTPKGGRSGSGTGGRVSGQSGDTGEGGDASEPPPIPPPGPDLPTTTEGFTDLEPSEDSRVIYVSSSEGDDSNDGLSEETPLKSVDAGLNTLRDGFPDWVLFKRGDTWDEGFGGWTHGGGRSPTERMVIGAYGEGERPRFEFRGTGISKHGGVDGPPESNNLAFVSLHFNATQHDVTQGNTGGSTGPMCINWLRPSVDVLWEDMRFQWCGVIVQAELPGTVARWRFFRSQFLDSYASVEEHSSGIFLNGVTTFSIEESMFDICGWYPSVAEAEPTIFNHCIYWQKQSPTDGLVRGNIIMRGASHGVQMRSAGKVLGNVLAHNAIAGFLADDIQPGEAYGEAIGNLILESEDTIPREGHPVEGNNAVPRGWGWGLETNNLDGVTYRYVMKDNIFSHCNATGTCSTAPAEFENSEISGNIVWDWKSMSGRELQESPGPFKDPDRTLASYNGSLGGEESFEAFATEIRRQSKTNWRKEYSAEAVIEYFRDGFSEP